MKGTAVLQEELNIWMAASGVIYPRAGGGMVEARERIRRVLQPSNTAVSTGGHESALVCCDNGRRRVMCSEPGYDPT